MEDWRPVIGWEHVYAVSSHGRVMRTAPGKRTQPGKILSAAARSAGYPCVRLVDGKRIRTYHVHRLVLEAFVAPPTEGRALYVAHKDGNKENSRLENLYWATPAENAFDMVKHGTARGTTAEHRRPVSDAIARDIRQDHSPAKVLAARYGISVSAVSAIRCRMTHKHVPPQPGDYVPAQKFRNYSDTEIRIIRADPRPNSVVARELGVSANTIRDIRSRKFYAHVD